MSLTFGSLFTGIGGFDLGFERAGMACMWQVEINDYCVGVLNKLWPTVRKFRDIREFPTPANVRGRFPGPGRSLVRRFGVDCIVGGDPCQGNSNAGSVWKKRHEDLGTEFVRVVATLRPRVVVRENPYPCRPDALWHWGRMRDELERLGYAVLPFRLRSCCLGADHRRDRVYLLGEHPDPYRFPNTSERRVAADRAAKEVRGEVREQRVRADAGSAPGGEVFHPDGIRLEGIDGQGEPEEHVGGTGCGSLFRQRPDGVPTPRICRSRNEVPHLVDRVTALGNSIDPIVAEWIGRRIVDHAGMA